jgi:serine/threonine-protein kinase
MRAARGFVCPQCKRRYDEQPVITHCTTCRAPVVKVRDMADADGDAMLGKTLSGRFTILAKLGAGSMGTVYRARQQAIGRDVAIKILRSDRAVDAAAKGRFLREARANSVLTSPNTVTVFDFGQSETGELYLAMELLEGESLGQRLKRMTRLPVEVCVETVRQALRSLAEAHAKGIIHRDLKPDNLFYARVLNATGKYEEIVKVVDFGIAKMLHDEGEQMNAVETQAGTVFGTPRYMSPEQAQGKPLDARSDLYSLGVILYHMLTGRPPFTDDDAIVVMARHIKTMPRPPSEVAPDALIPPELEAALMRVMAKEPTGRPESADAMTKELLRACELGIAGTSGVRSISTSPESFVVDGAPVSNRAPSMRSPPAAARSSVPDDSLATAAGVGVAPQRRTLTVAIAAAAFFGVLAIATVIYLVAVKGASSAASAQAGTATATTAPSGTAGASATTAATATSTPTTAKVTPPPPQPTATSTIPVVAATSLPIAPPVSATTATATHHPPHYQPPPPPPPPPTATSTVHRPTYQPIQ